MLIVILCQIVPRLNLSPSDYCMERGLDSQSNAIVENDVISDLHGPLWLRCVPLECP